jgi:uncharacterized iron-regulated membrane protein
MKDLLYGVFALLLTFGGGYWTGQHYEAKAQQEEVDKLNAQARAKEAALAAAVTTTANALRSSNEKSKTIAKQRDAAIDAGTIKLRVPIQAACPVPAATDPATPSGDNAREAAAESERAFIKAALALTDEGDRAVQKLNACIGLYNQAIESQKGIK